MRVYCVEDDADIRQLVCYALSTAGYQSEGFEEGSSFFERIADKLPDLVLLDIMLPGDDGIEILKKLRSNSRTKHLPAILLTAKGTEYDKVIGLDCGADDYIVKPFGVLELLSRIKALLRRVEPQSSNNSLVKGSLSMDTEKHVVKVGDVEISLAFKEFELLRCLLEQPGRVLTRDRLLERVWGYDFDGETRTVDVHIRTLRQKLGDTGDIIQTVRGVGYRIGEDI